MGAPRFKLMLWFFLESYGNISNKQVLNIHNLLYIIIMFYKVSYTALQQELNIKLSIAIYSWSD